jgi:hypothetical protein
VNSVQNRFNLVHILYTSFRCYTTRLFGKVYKMYINFSLYGWFRSEMYNRVKKTCTFCTLYWKRLPVKGFNVYRIEKKPVHILYTICSFCTHGKAKARLTNPRPREVDASLCLSGLFSGALTFWNDYNTRLQSIIRPYFQGNSNGKCNDME